MPFPPAVREKVLVRSARICCLCFKLCGTKFEVHHIEQEADGGANTEDNALPVCFDCHAEVGNYNPRHPKGTKFSPSELKSRREALFKLVDSGTLQALIIAQRMTSTAGVAVLALPAPRKPGAETMEFLRLLLEPNASVSAIGAKLGMLGQEDTAWVLDELLQGAPENPRTVEILARIVGTLGEAERTAVMDKLLRRVTLIGKFASKVALLREFTSDAVSLADTGIRENFFRDLLEIVQRDQFEEVNVLVPALIQHPTALPPSLDAEYLRVLLGQSHSSSYVGAPAARSALLALPRALATSAVPKLTARDLFNLSFMEKEFLRQFVEKHRSAVSGATLAMFDDYLNLGLREFANTHVSDYD